MIVMIRVERVGSAERRGVIKRVTRVGWGRLGVDSIANRRQGRSVTQLMWFIH